MKMFLRIKGQSTAEYAILLGIVIGVLVVMQTYVKRGIQGRFKETTDKYVNSDIGTGAWGKVMEGDRAPVKYDENTYRQYEFDKVVSQRTRDVIKDEQTETYSTGGTVNRSSTEETKQQEGDYQRIDR